MTQDEKVLKSLHDLIATCHDAAEGFAKAGKGVHDTNLGNWLAAASASREQFAGDLGQVIKEMGGTPGLDMHEGGILHRGWVDLEQRLRSTDPQIASKDDREIIEECIAGDSGSLPHYEHALAQDLPADLRLLVIQQKTSIDDTLVYLQNKVSRQKGQTA